MRDWVDESVAPTPVSVAPASVGPASVGPAPAAGPASRIDVLLDDGLTALLARDYKKAWYIFTEAHTIEPDNSLVQANLVRIEALGHRPKDDEPSRED